ncbi:MAG: MarR family transcriptional regulator [Desulfuromonadales bacterium]|nr:MarR family transcriptional regulator [Desulfuromonadales bacterium]
MRDLAKGKRKDSEKTEIGCQLLPETAPQVTRLTDVISYLHTEMNKDLPLQHIALLLAVVQQPGISLQDLMAHLGMPQRLVSRNVKLLSTPGSGYDLLSTSPGLVNRKQIMIFPTEKCSELIAFFCRLMQTDTHEELNRSSSIAARC